MMFQGDQRASLSSLSGDLASIMSRYRISKVGRQTPGRSDSPKRRSPTSGRHDLVALMAAGAGVGYLTIGSGRFFDLAGTVNSGIGAQVPDLDRVSPVIHFPGTYEVPPHKTMPATQVYPTSAPIN